MVKFKYTKKNNKNKTYNDDNNDSDNSDNSKSNSSILTSKNKNKLVLKGGQYYRKNNSIRKNKRTKSILNIRTLDKLSSKDNLIDNSIETLSPTQAGGFIIKYLKFKYKLKKIKKIIEKLNKNEKEINVFVDTYKTQTNTFKRLGDKKALVVYDYIRTQKDKTIIEYLKNNMKDLNLLADIKTSSITHSLEMIKTMEITIKKKLKQFEKEIKKEKPKFALNQKKFDIDSKKFRKINKQFQELQDFYTEQAEILDKYIDLEGKKQLRKEDEKEKKKYTKYKVDIDYILNFKQKNIDLINKQIQDLDTVLDKSDTYKTQFEKLKQSNYDDKLTKWITNYHSIFTNIQTIDGDIGTIYGTFKTIENIIEIIQTELSTIYIAIKKTDKLDPILKVKKILEINLKIIEIIKTSVKKVKFSFIQNTPIENIELNFSYVEGSLSNIQQKMKELKHSLIQDRSYLTNPKTLDSLTAKSISGGSSSGGSSSGGSSSGNSGLEYYTFKELKMNTFLDSNYETIIYTLIQINSDLKNTNSKLYNEENKDILKILNTYFNVYLFFMYYINKRDVGNSELKAEEKDLSIDETNKDIILFFITMIKTYETIIKNTAPEAQYDAIPNYLKDSIQTTVNKNIVTLDNLITKIKSHLDIYYNHISNKSNDYVFINDKDKDKETIKNLDYYYNPYSDDKDQTNNLGCIKAFIGYNKEIDTEFKTYEDKSKCHITEKNFLKLGDKKEFLHLNYLNIPVLYDINDDRNSDSKYQFVTVYFNNGYGSDITKVTHYNDYDNIQSEYDSLEKFLNLLIISPKVTKPATPPKPQHLSDRDDLHKFIYEANQHIGKEELAKMFCNDDTNKYIETAIGNMVTKNTPADGIDVTGTFKIDKIKKDIVSDWTSNTNVNFISGPVSKNLIFQDIYDKDIFQQSILPYLLLNVYNNHKFTYIDNICKPDNNLQKILTIQNTNDKTKAK
jgi:hypothetical protein